MSLRVLHITDLHLTPEPGSEIYGSDPDRTLARVLSSAQSLPDPPDLVIATGDLTEGGDAASYGRLRERLVGTGLPSYVVAGNHDSFRGMKEALLGDTVRMESVLDVDGWRLILLNSRVRGESFGRLDDSELTRLDEALSEDRERPALIGFHHSPTPPCPSTGCHLENALEMLDVLAPHPNARVVIAGHNHREFEGRAAEITLYTTPSTCSQAIHAQQGEPVDHEDFWDSHSFDASRQGFRMLTLEADGSFDSEVHWLGAGTRR
jgi:Icc protein